LLNIIAKSIEISNLICRKHTSTAISTLNTLIISAKEVTFGERN
jgi:hypothetical protein